MFRELETKNSIFDLRASRFFLGDPAHDLSVRFHGKRAATPLGPAAGPQSQLAQNIVLSWLGGSRIIELKTVQVLDELEIPRPCIDMRNIGYNVEWSQELKLEQSLEEYVKASMLIDMLVASGKLELTDGFDAVIYDMSVGYDLKGIQTDRVRTFIEGMLDASAVVADLKTHIPDGFAHLRDIAFRTRLSDTLTLSTFHGCPPDEIESIIDYLLEDVGLNCVIKLNPTLLGPDEARRLLHDELGYTHLHTPAAAFAKDTTWDQAVAFVERLRTKAHNLGLGLGVKFTNTLIVEHDGVFIPDTEKEKYLSGPPLHVLAMHLVGRMREQFGADLPISFSAGIERRNFADAVALGLTPITVCSDLLKPGGYARQVTYIQELIRRMDAVGANDIPEFISKSAGGSGGDRGLRAAELENTRNYVATLASDPHYALPGNSKLPKKVGTDLVLFDCLTCDKCVPVCPNDANFTLTIEPREIPLHRVRLVDGHWKVEAGGTLELAKKHQIASYADFCNECGNCDVFCPEDGGPYLEKPRFFGRLREWQRFADLDGFFVEEVGDEQWVYARILRNEYRLMVHGHRAEYSGDGFCLRFLTDNPLDTIQGQADAEVDMRWYHVMDVLRESVFESNDINWVNAG